MEELGSASLQRLFPEKAEAKSDSNAQEREKRLKKACADFESLLLYHMLKKMRSTIPKSGLIKEMQGKDTYETIMDQKVSEKLADQGGIGLQKMLFNQIKKGL